MSAHAPRRQCGSGCVLCVCGTHGRSSACVGLLSVIHGKSCVLHVADFFSGHAHAIARESRGGVCGGAAHTATRTLQPPSVLHAGECIIAIRARRGRCFNYFCLNISLCSCVCSQSPPTPYTQVQIITNKALSDQECRNARGALDTIATPYSPRRKCFALMQPAGGGEGEIKIGEFGMVHLPRFCSHTTPLGLARAATCNRAEVTVAGGFSVAMKRVHWSPSTIAFIAATVAAAGAQTPGHLQGGGK
jgi:hypothetical protein